MQKKIAHWVFAFFATCGLGGCGGSVPIAKIEMSQLQSPQPAAPYRIRPGDEIEIRSSYTPELNATTIIRPDGKISLDLIGQVDAAGLTIEALDSALAARYARFFVEPELTVTVRGFSGYKIFVGGEVAHPGLIPYDENLTVLRAIIQVGGLKNSAKSDNVLVLRDMNTRETVMMKINLNDIVRGKQINKDFRLEPFDIIFVPRSSIAKMNQFVEQYIHGLLPLGTVSGFLWTYRLLSQGY